MNSATYTMTVPDILYNEVYNSVPKFLSSEDKKYKTDADERQMTPKIKGRLCSLNKMVEKLSPQIRNNVSVDIARETDAIRYCAENSLIKYLAIAESLIKVHFPTVKKIYASLEHDPELLDSWVVMTVQISGEIDEVIDWEDNFIEEWVENIPYPESEKIRLSCDIE